MDKFVNQLLQCYWNKMINLRPLTQCAYAMLYPQNGDRIVTINYMTSLHPMYRTYWKIKKT